MISDNQQPTLFQKDQGKDKHFKAQMKRVLAAFMSKPSTMLMVERETGVMRSNITWFIREWRLCNKIFLLEYGTCPITKKRGVGFYTANPEMIKSGATHIKTERHE